MSKNLHPDAARAIEFLSWLNPGAPLRLEHMSSDGPERPVAVAFPPQEVNAANRFVTDSNADSPSRNMYWLPNAEFLSGKRAKANLSAARFLHVDLDCKDYPGTPDEQADMIIGLLLDAKERPKGVPAPSAVWFTGGGYQAVWRLAEPIDTEQAGELNRALLAALQGGPGTHDPSRLLRLPHTVNWLNEKKRKAGREPKLAFVMEPVDFSTPPISYKPDDFSLKLEARSSNDNGKGALTVETTAIDPMPLPEDLAEILPSDSEWVGAIVDGKAPSGKLYGSRSELVFAAAIWMIGKGVAPGHVVAILMNPGLGISAHVLEQPNALRCAQRQVARAMSFIAARGGDWPYVTERGHPVESHPGNIRYALARLGVDARRNLFLAADEVTGADLDDRDLNDIADILNSRFRLELQFKAASAAIKSELVAVAHEQSYHPVVDYLDSLCWDGTPRLDTWLRDYCGAEDTALNREFGTKFLIAGVRRIREPGVKFDTMLVLEGEQGAGKSRLAAKLAVRDEWFCDSLDLKSDDKTKAELLAKAWIVECQELDGMSKTTSQSLKKFLGTRIDTYRKAYARDAHAFKRHCVIVGTTNEDAYLRDLSGNRRFWPVLVGEIDLKRFGDDVHQLWAEAAAREAKGESIVLSRELWAEAKRLQQTRMVEDAFEPVLEGWFAGRTGRVSLESVKLLLGFEGGRMSTPESQRLRAIMEGLGWEAGKQRLFDLTGTSRDPRQGFARGTPKEREEEWIAKKVEGGLVALVPVDARKGSDTPF